MSIQKLIAGGLAAAAFASAALPASSAYLGVWPDIDFDWYTSVGTTPPAETTPAPRAGYIWAPGRYETLDGRETWVAGQWVKDDFAEQVARVQRVNLGEAS
jgi:hypothetical protein